MVPDEYRTAALELQPQGNLDDQACHSPLVMKARQLQTWNLSSLNFFLVAVCRYLHLLNG